MKYLGIPLEKPKVAFFGFTGCEGCQLQIANKEETLADLLGAVEVMSFRLISSDKDDGYDIAFVEGSITTEGEVERLKKIRAQAKILVAIGACACLGGVNNLRSRFPLDETIQEVYGNHVIESGPVRKLSEVVTVDYELPGCPISKAEFEWLVRHVIVGVIPQLPQYPVCVECKQRIKTCVFDMGIMCMGPVTRAGCNAICPSNHMGCWGCRGAVDEANFESFIEILRERGFAEREIAERANFFNAFSGVDVIPQLEG
ncbi:MAG: NADH:ubiquinone oxidoreductase [Anaerolineales bacterium]|nr:NADH:ubiquinone oxidoreductase [Chloroflexota bacterium]MBL6982212.1 NADH:ubiquinone oxidoreductase [Anaerolineales bacterium]